MRLFEGGQRCPPEADDTLFKTGECRLGLGVLEGLAGGDLFAGF